MKVALITGITGQDGSYLAELLLEKGYVSTGKEYSIKEVAESVSRVVGYNGKIMWDTTKPNGTIKRPLYIQKIKDLGWSSKIELEDGITKAYQSFLETNT